MMEYRRLFENEQELERLFILYGNTTDCYFNGYGSPFLSFEPLLESHLGSLDYQRIIFYSGKEILKCYNARHAEKLKELVNPSGGQEDEKRQEPRTSGVMISTPSRFRKKTESVSRPEQANEFTFSVKQERIHRLLDQAMRDKSTKTCVVFTHCWSMLDMQTNGELKEQLADMISGWYSLSTNNHNIAVFLFGEPRLESLASFLRNKSAWAFLYERMFSNDLPTDAVIQIGGPQRDEIYQQTTGAIGEFLYTPEVEKAALTLVQKQGNKLLSLRRYLEHQSAKAGVSLAQWEQAPSLEQRQVIVGQLLKDYGDEDAVDAVEKISQTEGWQEISQMVIRLIEEANSLPKQEESITEINQWLKGSCLRLTVRDEKALPGVNMTIMLKGSPGTGKTTAAHWIGEAFRQNGLLPVGRIITATKDQLEAGYVGQSAIKTREKINEAIGNVLFIDEAYSLFRSEDEGRASFGREVIDTLVEAMTAHRGEMAFILAGYPKEMDHFLTANPGLRRRFGDNIVSIADYDAGMLERIALDDLASDSGEGVSDSREDPRLQSLKRQYLLAGDLVCAEAERGGEEQPAPKTPGELREKTRQDREEGRELCPFSVYFDNWFADRNRETFGNAGAALQLADSLRQSARRRAAENNRPPEEPVLITREDFPEGTAHLFECRKPSVKEIEEQMKDVVGMGQVQQTLRRIMAYVQLAVLQQSLQPGEGRRRVEPGHYLFVGNPGTGKTMISEKLALALSGLGVIQRYRPIRVTGLELTNYLTEHRGVDKLMEFVNSCSGGVLVIDEAHQLTQTNLGPLAVKTLLDPMVEKKYDMSFVFCCYPEEEKEFLAMEPGLARRISDIIRFDDYQPEDILKILQLKAAREGYQVEEEVAARALEAIRELTELQNQNGGTAEKMFKAMKIAMSERLMTAHGGDIREMKKAAESDPSVLTRFAPEDADAALKQLMALMAEPPQARPGGM